MKTFKVVPREIKEQILNRIKNEGVTVIQAANDAGVSSKTIYNWLRAKTFANVSILEVSRLRRENRLLLEMLGKWSLEKEQDKRTKKS
jgi:transposase-like protein